MQKLLVENRADVPDEYPYLQYVVKKLQQLIFKSIISDKLIQFNKYFNDNKEIFSENGRILDAKTIILTGANNFKIATYPLHYVIEMDKNQKMPNFTTFKVYDLCSLINDGNLELKPYPIFTDCIKYINTHINNMYEVYKSES